MCSLWKKGICLCPEKFALSTVNFTTGPSDFASDSVSQDDNSGITSTTQSLLASGERVLLQTATVLLQTSNGRSSIKARVLLDSASQRTFMTSQLAQRLNLALEDKEILSISTFGAQKATDIIIHTYVVCFKAKLKDGTFMTISANVLSHITGSIQRGPSVQKDLEFLESIPSEKLADCLPDTLENTIIDLLIGSDYFWEIIGNDKVILPSGMSLIPSKFGYIVTGKFPDDKQCLCNCVHTLMVTAKAGQATYDLENLWCLEAFGIIPRLELLVVLIGIRAANFVMKQLRLKITDRILWTDSQCVLYWLKTKKLLLVFVESRVREIKREKDITYRYVPTLDLYNPSDHATMGFISVGDYVFFIVMAWTILVSGR